VQQPPVLPARRAHAAARGAAEVAAAAAAVVAAAVVEAAGAARGAHVKPAKGAGFARGQDHPRHGVELKGVHGRRKRKVGSQVAERGPHDHVLCSLAGVENERERKKERERERTKESTRARQPRELTKKRCIVTRKAT
jgi:hypothetical protein